MRVSWNGTKNDRLHGPRLRTGHQMRPTFEELEVRNLLSDFTGYSPTQIRQAYGFSQLSILHPGLGETIAIVDPYEAPQIQADLNTFDSKYSLPAINLSVVNDGATKSDPTGASDEETALDVEWAHAIAPYANIVLVEATDDSVNSMGVPVALLHAASVAASQPNVRVVSMSWGVPEFKTETRYDSYFTTPGVTFVAASGDNGAPAMWWPAISPNVVAVGGTTLQTTNSGSYLSETGWGSGSRSALAGGSGGGVSQYETEPSYQQGGSLTGVTSAQNSGNRRMSPDVAYDANPASGVAVYDQTNGGWLVLGGTSAGAPQWAALVALADQVRAGANQPSLSSMQTLTALYQEQGEFHDITSGNNGYAAGVGYDLVTGLGTPEANLLVSALANQPSSATPNPTPSNPPGNRHLADQLFVIQIYQSLLGRTADAGGLANWSNLLDQGTSPSSVVLQIEQSQEYLTNAVGAIYQKMLQRQADPSGLATFTTLLANGGTLEQVETAIAGSQEYFQTRSGGKISGFLDALYADALSRAVDPVGQAAFGHPLSQEASREAVAAAVFASDEYRRDLVENYYQAYLGRQADSDGLMALVAALRQGTNDQAVIAAILGSQEYFQRLPVVG
jgi:hypothetical protein